MGREFPEEHHSAEKCPAAIALLWVSPVCDQGPISLTVSRMKLEECTQSEETG